MFKKTTIAQFDPELAKAMAQETQRQEDHIELIASENYVSHCVMEAQGSQLTNKYAEGYPNHRYYGGCEYVDLIEQLAIDRARELFHADYANVQPHSGSQANSAVFHALVQTGDTILGMSLDAGGHLTHGAKPSFSGKHYHAVQYGLNDQELIDYDEVAKLARQHKPKMIIAGYSAYSQEIDWAYFRKIANENDAFLMADMAHVAGLVAVGEYSSPLPYAHVVTSTTHKTLRGPRGGLLLAAQGNDTLYKKLNSAIFPGEQGGPLLHVIAAKAICFKEAQAPAFKTYQQQVKINAKAMAAVFTKRGYHIVSNGTVNHLFLISLAQQGITGKDAEAALGRAFITVNKNSVPKDPHNATVTSGLRIGTPAVTTRGFEEAQVIELSHWICDVLDTLATNTSNLAIVENQVKQKVLALCKNYPVYGN